MLPLQEFRTYIQQQDLFTPEHKILLAVSGGRDSVLLAELFKASGFNFGIAHCNFGLRDAESQRDEHFVRLLASAMEVPLHVTGFDTRKYAAEQQVSTQMAARTLRYDWFAEILQTGGYDYIAVAHHLDDAVETVLLNLVRGTGIAGLHGIPPKRGKIIRPLLFLTRAGIDALIESEGLDYVEDSSNLSTDYARNKIRLEVMPRLREINPSLEHTFDRNIRRFSETELVLQQAVLAAGEGLFEQRNGGIWLPAAKVRALHPGRLLLAGLLKPYGFTEAVAEEILQALDKQSGTSFYSRSCRLTINRDYLVISPADPDELPVNTLIHPGDRSVSLHDRTLTITFTDPLHFRGNPDRAFTDADKLVFPLVIRSWQQGDRFMPLGMDRFKKLSDLFIDQKVPVPEKANIPVLVNGNGEVVWVAGLRQDNRYKVTASTKKVAIFEQKLK